MNSNVSSDPMGELSKAVAAYKRQSRFVRTRKMPKWVVVVIVSILGLATHAAIGWYVWTVIQKRQ